MKVEECARNPLAKSLYNHLVLDIETLGVKHGAPILSIGAVLGSVTFHRNIKFDITRAEPDTLLWWMTTPSKTAQQVTFMSSDVELVDALRDLNKFINRYVPKYFWGNSPDFDFGHLEYWYKAWGIEIPWKYWQLRDIRTIKDYVNVEPLDYEQKHIALNDAIYEQYILNEFLKRMEQ